MGDYRKQRRISMAAATMASPAIAIRLFVCQAHGGEV
jgi:hypothetical protein